VFFWSSIWSHVPLSPLMFFSMFHW
jgi:hypothetical protein